MVCLQAAHEVIALAGFHIKRQEFEPEYDNEAEMIVADMEFRDDDTEVNLRAHLLDSIVIKSASTHVQKRHVTEVCTFNLCCVTLLSLSELCLKPASNGIHSL